MPRVSAAIGHIKLSKLKPGHIQEFYAQLAQSGIREDGKYKAKAAFIEAFPKGKRLPVMQAAGVTQHTFTSAMAGRNVSKRSAEKIATAAGWAFTKAFACSSADTLSANSQRHYHLMLSSMFNTAVRWQLMDSKRPATVVAGTWAAISKAAFEWRRLWKRHGGRPCSLRNTGNQLETTFGSIGLPSGFVNSKSFFTSLPPSMVIVRCQNVPTFSRSRICHCL